MKYKSEPFLVVCHGVTDEMTCRFKLACYGEICVAPDICIKKDEELTSIDLMRIEDATRDE